MNPKRVERAGAIELVLTNDSRCDSDTTLSNFDNQPELDFYSKVTREKVIQIVGPLLKEVS